MITPLGNLTGGRPGDAHVRLGIRRQPRPPSSTESRFQEVSSRSCGLDLADNANGVAFMAPGPRFGASSRARPLGQAPATSAGRRADLDARSTAVSRAAMPPGADESSSPSREKRNSMVNNVNAGEGSAPWSGNYTSPRPRASPLEGSRGTGSPGHLIDSKRAPRTAREYARLAPAMSSN
jgi:hypothetical protein